MIIYFWVKTSFWTLTEDIVDGQMLKSRYNKKNIVSKFLYWMKDKFVNIK